MGVGFLTLRSQENARRAGESGERERRLVRERALRRAMEQVRASLNMEIVMRNAVREAQRVTMANSVLLVSRASSLDLPDQYEASGDEVTLKREPLAPELGSLIESARSRERIVTVGANDPLAGLLHESVTVATIELDNGTVALIIGWGPRTPTSDEQDAVQDFTDNLAVALQQARLFIRLAEQNEEILRGRSELQNRSEIIRDIVYALAHDLRTPLVAADVTMDQALERRIRRVARPVPADSRDDARVDRKPAPLGGDAVARRALRVRRGFAPHASRGDRAADRARNVRAAAGCAREGRASRGRADRRGSFDRSR